MKIRRPAALVFAGALAFAACGSDDNGTNDEPVTTEAMSDDEMTDDEMTDDEMSDDEMSDDDMTDDEMSDDDMSDDDMTDDEMSDDEMSDDEMSDDDMTDEMSDDMMSDAEGDVIVVAATNGELSTFVAAVDAAGLTATLSGDGPFTIFAPSNAAFEAYLGDMGMTLDDAVADTAALSTLLQNHVVSAADDSDMVSGMVDNPFISLAGNELPVTVDGDTITIGGAEIIEADIYATNGVVHVIDTVISV
ncbi:MAG: fasciclin domain-containing protein [Ilumatobacteraceae bacterium]